MKLLSEYVRKTSGDLHPKIEFIVNSSFGYTLICDVSAEIWNLAYDKIIPYGINIGQVHQQIRINMWRNLK